MGGDEPLKCSKPRGKTHRDNRHRTIATVILSSQQNLRTTWKPQWTLKLEHLLKLFKEWLEHWASGRRTSHIAPSPSPSRLSFLALSLSSCPIKADFEMTRSCCLCFYNQIKLPSRPTRCSHYKKIKKHCRVSDVSKKKDRSNNFMQIGCESVRQQVKERRPDHLDSISNQRVLQQQVLHF